MKEAAQSPYLARFDAFEVNLRSGELCKNGERIRLPKQSFQILAMLLEHPGEVVTRQEIQNRLWPNDTVVEFENSINAAIKRLRVALGDSADQPRYIETLARRGYRWKVPVEWAEPPLAEPQKPAAAGFASAVDTSAFRLIGKRVSHYRVLEILGGGGMGVVYKAEDLKLGRRVALKFLPEELSHDAAAMERFEREARAASALNHPNICTIYEVEEHEGQPFIVMELLEGQTLRELISSAARSGLQEDERKECLPLQTLLNIAIQIVDGLDAAHRKGIIHRDIKPANVFICDSGAAKILDFGLAKLIHSPTDSTITSATELRVVPQDSVSSPGTLLGTLMYMSPEQVRGEELDQRTDLFSCSSVLYEMATAAAPFWGPTAADVKNAILHQTPTEPQQLNPRLPAALGRIICQGLERNRELRYQKASDLRADLQQLRLATALGRMDTAASTLQLLSKFTRARRKWIWPCAAVLVLVVLGTVLLAHRRKHQAKIPAAVPMTVARRSVAVLGFQNLSDDHKVAWLSTAFSEMFATELGVGEQLRTVPSEDIAQTKVSLSLPDTDTLSKATLVRLRKNLGVDLVVLGSFSAVGDVPRRKIRLDVRVQDADEGTTIASISETGSQSDLYGLVSQAGAHLREKLGVTGLTSTQSASVIASLPSQPQVARLYSEGLEKFRTFDALAARDLFVQSVAAEPNYPLSHSALADAYSALGYDARARTEAEKAFRLAGSLPREEQLFIEANYRQANKDWDKAAELYRDLFSYAPDSPEYGLRLADIELLRGQPKNALATIADLQRLAPLHDDPRIDLAESKAHEALADYKQAAEDCSRGLAKAKASGARLIVARTLDILAWVQQQTGQSDLSISNSEQAKAIYLVAGDLAGVGRALKTIAINLEYKGDVASALKAYDEAISFLRKTGDLRDLASVLNDEGILFMHRGDMPQAMKRYSEALRDYTEVENKRGMAIVLGNTAEMYLIEGQLVPAAKTYERVLSLFVQVGDKYGYALTIGNLGHVQAARGELDKALHSFDQALLDLRAMDDKSDTAEYLFASGDVRRAQGNVAEARKAYGDSLSLRKEIGERGMAAESQLGLAELLIDEGRPEETTVPLREAQQELESENRIDDRIWACAVQARAWLAQNRIHEAEEEINHAARLLPNSAALLPHFKFAITAARVEAAMGKIELAKARLRRTLKSAHERGFVAFEFESRLAFGEIELKSGKTVAGLALLQALERDAKAKGFLLIVRKAEDTAKGAG